MKLQIVLSGVGGQGLISTGEIIGEAASIYENIYATLASSYGSETRGTFTKSDVIIADEPISYPNILVPDRILCLAQVAYDRYRDQLDEHTILYYDSDLVVPDRELKARQLGHPFRRMGIEMGNMAVANSIALGLMMRECPMIRKENLMAAMRDYFAAKPKVIELNIRAIEAGYAL